MAFYAASLLPAIFPRAAMFHPENTSRSGGGSISGAEQIVVSPTARWRARLSGPVVTENAVLSWRAFIGGMNGRAGTVLVPKFEHYGPRDANGKRLDEQHSVLYGDDGLFNENGLNFDLTGWGQDDSTVYATLAANAALNATEIVVDYAEGIDGIRPGQYLGIGQRLYLAHSVWQEDVGDPTHIRFTPWLRAAASAGDTVIIDKPVCLMRFASDATGELELDFGRWGNGALDLVEAF